jgi:hypothetical protein
MMADVGSEQVWVQVVDVDLTADREITFSRNMAEKVVDRQADIRAGVEAGAAAVADSLKSLASPEGWQLREVSASFGVTLTAEAGVMVSKASAGATLEVSVKFTRE